MQSINNHTTTTNSSHGFPKSSLGTRQNDGLLISRVALSKEVDKAGDMQNGGYSAKVPAAAAEAGAESFRSVHSVYYAGATGNVPFLWESRPGTPKHASNDSSIPPLTPPPSYSYSKSKAENNPAHKKRGNSYKHSPSTTIFCIINLPKVLPRRSRNNNSCVTPKSSSTATPTTSSSASVNSSSSSSSCMSPAGTPRPKKSRPRRRTMFSRWRSDQLFAGMDDGEEAYGMEGSASSPFCFGGGGPSSSRRNRGRYTVRHALSSIVWGHRSSRTVICTS